MVRVFRFLYDYERVRDKEKSSNQDFMIGVAIPTS